MIYRTIRTSLNPYIVWIYVNIKFIYIYSEPFLDLFVEGGVQNMFYNLNQ